MQGAASELGLDVHAFPWTDAAHHAGFKRGAAYLVRPDGHVGLADPNQDPAALRDYARSIGLSGFAQTEVAQRATLRE